MLKEPLADSSPIVVKARSVFGVIGALGVMSITARVFWRRMKQEREPE